MLKKLREVLFCKAFISFIIVGGINTINGTLFSMIYSQFFSDTVAFIPGYLSATIVAYFLNTTFTFKQAPCLYKLIGYAVSTIPNFIIQLGAVYINVHLFKMPNYISYLGAAIVGIPITFIILKVFIFTKRENKERKR